MFRELVFGRTFLFLAIFCFFEKTFSIFIIIENIFRDGVWHVFGGRLGDGSHSDAVS